MLEKRVIPTLLMDQRRLVKTRGFRNASYLGDPINVAKIFSESGANELIILDIGVGRTRQEPDYDYIEVLASECFVPLTYGGGIRNAGQASRITGLGVEKVAIRTAWLEDASTLSAVSDRLGAQSVVASMDLVSHEPGVTSIYAPHITGSGTLDWKEMLTLCVERGAGEVLIQDVQRDGKMCGPDLGLVGQLAELDLTVPLVVGGGVGSLSDLKSLLAAGADAVAVGAFFVLHGPHRAVLVWYPNDEEMHDLVGVA